jgi:hypothetical protein
LTKKIKWGSESSPFFIDKLKKVFQDTSTMKLNTPKAKELTAIVLGEATKAVKKAALNELLVIAGETAIREERERDDRARRMWGTPTHGW